MISTSCKGKWIVSTMLASFVLSFSTYAEPFLDNFPKSWQEETPYKSPTKRFLGKHSWQTIQWTLQTQGVILKQKPFYDVVMSMEERGFMGYNASGHKFRVFQDIVKITLEEKLGMEFKKDFHFFRVPSDPSINDHPTAHDFLNKHYPINDNLPEQRNQLISTNFSLYNNFDQKYECSAVFFEKSISYKPPEFDSKIGFLFECLGMPKDEIKALFKIGETLEHKDGGTLFQFFDFSHHDPSGKNIYDFVDHLCYPCIKKGEPIYSPTALSDLYLGTFNSSFLSQYRIVINHNEVLNPYSSLYIRRYDLNSPAVVEQYEKKLRAAIRKIPHDTGSTYQFKQQLLEYWNLEQ